MDFWEIAEAVQARQYYVTRSQAITRAAEDVLEGFHWRGKVDLDQAAEYAKELTHDRRIFTGLRGRQRVPRNGHQDRKGP